ncbi:MAG: ABC transporter permease, partial [Kineosporiaceae bacterium]
YALRDSATMLRRTFKHMVRYPSVSLLVVGLPVILLLLFVYVFGGTMGAGLPGGGGRQAYLAYITPAILMLTVSSVAAGTAITAATDMTGGIVARFRTMAVSRAAVLSGHVLGATVRTALALAAVLAVALLLGLRAGAGPAGWLGAAGLLLLTGFALTWLCVALGLASPTVEAASNWPLPLVFLPFLGSGFVPVASMPVGLRWFAEYQPFTPIMDTLRALLSGAPVDVGSAWTAIAWCLAIAAASYGWARRLFDRNRARAAG